MSSPRTEAAAHNGGTSTNTAELCRWTEGTSGVTFRLKVDLDD